MRETRSSGSVRGVSGDGRPYRERYPDIPSHRGEGRVSTLQLPFSGFGARASKAAARPLSRK